jgi:hypothetical protein
MPRGDDMADMIRNDLAAARLGWLDEAPTPEDRAERERSMFLCDQDDENRVFDFHALRHTFLTNLARAGVHPNLAQSLARNSDPKLTMTRYTHTSIGEQSDALAKLPDLTEAFEQQACATGTAGTEMPVDGYFVLADCLARNGAEWSNSVQSDALLPTEDPPEANLRFSRETKAFPENHAAANEVRPGGFEPPTCGLGIY